MNLQPGLQFRFRPWRGGAFSGRVRATVLCFVVALTSFSSSLAFADDNPIFKVGGLLFGDAYYVSSHHTDEGDGAAGFVLRRGYLTLNSTFSENWSGRLRYEVNQSGRFEHYDFDGQIKDLYVGRKAGRHRFVVGLSPTLTYDLIESIWGLRYLARTPMDLQGVASRDTGVTASGPLNAAGTLSYRAMIAPGVEFEADSNDSSKVMGALTWKPSPPWTVDLYADFENRTGSNDRTMFQLFVGNKTESFRWGVQYSNQDRKDDPPLELASAFVVARLGERASLIGRVDRLMEPSPKGNGISYLPFDPTARATMFIAAVEFRIASHISVTPNAVVTTYDRNDQGIRPETDLHLRVTFFVNFE